MRPQKSVEGQLNYSVYTHCIQYTYLEFHKVNFLFSGFLCLPEHVVGIKELRIDLVRSAISFTHHIYLCRLTSRGLGFGGVHLLE